MEWTIFLYLSLSSYEHISRLANKYGMNVEKTMLEETNDKLMTPYCLICIQCLLPIRKSFAQQVPPLRKYGEVWISCINADEKNRQKNELKIK